MGRQRSERSEEKSWDGDGVIVLSQPKMNTAHTLDTSEDCTDDTVGLVGRFGSGGQ